MVPITVMHRSREDRGYWSAPIHSMWFCVLSLAALLIFRAIYSTPIEIDGDSVGKWYAASSIARDGKWDVIGLDHHQLRWSVMFPQILIAKVFPWRYENYYVLPMLLYSLFTIICMLVLLTELEKQKWHVVLLLAVVVSIDPISHVMASQLKTVAFGLFYLSIGIIIFRYYLSDRRVWFLLLSALCFFLSYGAHITYILFSLAPLLVLVLHLREYRTALIFLTALISFIAAETLLTGILFNSMESGGRLQFIVSGTAHQPVAHAITLGARARELEYQDLFGRWKMVPKYNFLILIGYLFGAGLLSAKRMRQSVPIGIWLFFYAAGIYGLAVTFPIVSSEPLQLAMSLHSRYLAPFFPLALVFIVWVVHYLSKNRKRLEKVLTIGASTILIVIFLAGSYSYRCIDEPSPKGYLHNVEGLYCHSFRYTQNQNIYPAPDAFIFKAQPYYEEFSKDYMDGKVSLFGGVRLGYWNSLVKFINEKAQIKETPKGWYSVDGQDKEWCVMELGQMEMVEKNYHNCTDTVWLEEEIGPVD